MEENKEIKVNDIKNETAEELGLVVPRNMGDFVNNTMQKYMERGLKLPDDYNVQNAVVSSYLIIKQDPKLSECSKDSIASALIDMATMGLNASKSQCYFVPYAGKVQLQPSYYGKIMAIKRINGVVDVISDVIYEDTEYELSVDEYGNDEIKITKPCPLDKRTTDKLVGAWAKIILDEKIWGRKTHTSIMTLDQIHKSWQQGATKGNSPAHKNFADEMCKKTVINRCCKTFVNSAKDQDILVETLNRTTANEYLDEDTGYKAVVKEPKEIDV